MSWLLYLDAKLWGKTPSEYLRITDPYKGYCLDQAIGFFGSKIETELQEAEDKVRSRKGKVRESAIKQARERVLREYGILGEEQHQPRQFADPALLMT